MKDFTAMYLISAEDYKKYKIVLAQESCQLCALQRARLDKKDKEESQSAFMRILYALPGVLCSKFA